MASSSSQLISRADTSLCPHLAALLSSPSSGTSNGHANGVNGHTNGAGGSVNGHGEGSGEGAGTKRAEVEKRFVKVVQWGAVAQGAKRRKTSPPQCNTCSTTLARPWACLTCSYIGCLPLVKKGSSSRECMKAHWRESGGRCAFAVDPSTGTIYCSACADTTYPDSFESLLLLTRTRVEESADHSREPGLVGGRGRGRGAWKPWDPSSLVGVESGEVEKTSCRGLRPLLNLSQTCFLSAVLQALIHNPLLKAYFLSDKHNRHVCQNGSKGLLVGKPFLGAEGNGAVGAEREKGCMCCEMDRAFEEFYNEDKSPFGPVTMLYAMWHASAELEGHGQQDAHSFFLAALDQIHAHARGQLSSCNCIAHQTFAGSLLSSVTCSSCSSTSTTVDPILDIQLDFPTSSLPLPLPSSSSSTPNPHATTIAPDSEPLTLAGMLRKFCAEEKVGDPAGRGYDCSACGGGAGVVGVKRLTVDKLAPVLSFQLKRFAQSSTSTSKIESHVRFPSTLDMSPYVSPSTAPPSAPDSSPDPAPAPTTAATPLPASLFMYDLFAVVTHEGKLDNGHYWADVRSGDEWYHCDDDKVTPASLGSVLAQRAYMLFYVKRGLGYGESMSRLLAGNGA
ncbi:hypothetical protein IAT38_003771 [Cryptococcus sp. DSM 104549]